MLPRVAIDGEAADQGTLPDGVARRVDRCRCAPRRRDGRFGLPARATPFVVVTAPMRVLAFEITRRRSRRLSTVPVAPRRQIDARRDQHPPTTGLPSSAPAPLDASCGGTGVVGGERPLGGRRSVLGDQRLHQVGVGRRAPGPPAVGEQRRPAMPVSGSPSRSCITVQASTVDRAVGVLARARGAGARRPRPAARAWRNGRRRAARCCTRRTRAW